MCDLELNLLFNLGRHTDSAQKCGLERYFQLGSQACRANAGISRIALGRADRSHRQVYEMTRRAAISPMIKSGDPNGIRTRVTAVKGRCPRPLDDRVKRPPNIGIDHSPRKVNCRCGLRNADDTSANRTDSSGGEPSATDRSQTRSGTELGGSRATTLAQRVVERGRETINQLRGQRC